MFGLLGEASCLARELEIGTCDRIVNITDNSKNKLRDDVWALRSDIQHMRIPKMSLNKTFTSLYRLQYPQTTSQLTSTQTQ